MPACPACERKGHDLKDCWYVFKDLKPDHIVLSQHATDKVAKKLEGSGRWRQQVDKVKKEKDKKKKNDPELVL